MQVFLAFKTVCGIEIIAKDKVRRLRKASASGVVTHLHHSSAMALEEEKLVFAVNGERFELVGYDPSTTLLEFLRTQTKFRGVKLGCGEGGCGACVVLLSKYDPVQDQVEDLSASSCLTLLITVNGCSVTTSEGLGNSKDGFHAIHHRLSGFHASQCGYCTPGMCMSLFSSIVNSEKRNIPDHPVKFSKLTVAEAEKAIAGNLCRCTGYRPIADACKSFAFDVDMEDLGLNSFCAKGEKRLGVDSLPLYNPKSVCTFPEFLKEEIRSQAYERNAANLCCRPKTIEEFDSLIKSEIEKEKKVKFVVGNTASGVYKERDLYDRYIDISRIPDLSATKIDDSGIKIGAAVTISKTIKVLTEGNHLVYTKIADHLNKIASEFVRNKASIGGNLVLSQKFNFPSDVATVLLAVDSSVTLHTGTERLKVSLEEYLESPNNSQTLLLSIFIPNWAPKKNLSGKSCSFKFETYRAAPRPLGNAVSYANAAILANYSTNSSSGTALIERLQLAYGAYGSKHALRATNVEKFLTGKPLIPDVLLEATRLVKEIVIPEDGTSHSTYRTSLAVSFLFNFFKPLLKDLKEKVPHVGTANNGFANGSRSEGAMNGLTWKSLLSSRQDIHLGKDYLPVGAAVKKAAAEIQASGEAVYVDDIPSPKDCLFGAFICSTKPVARVKNISFTPSSVSKKIFTVISADDIPKRGENIGSTHVFGTDRLFADKCVEFAGEPIGFVLAETQKYANMAAKQAIVDYETEGIEPPILTVEEAVDRSSFFQPPPFLTPKPVGDFSKGMAEAGHKILSAEIKLGSQYYFYMETQTALAVPDEDNSIVVYTSSQCPENTQIAVAKCLGIPQHNVRVITRRVGGGFGGKAMKSIPVATACALAAYKLHRPVRTYVDRKTDMILAGGRHPMKINYSVGFNSDGEFKALKVNILVNAGVSPDISPMMPSAIVSALKKYNWGALSFDIKLCKTNHCSKSAMRAPGDLQGSYIAEAIIEHVAATLSVEVDSVRKKNLHDYHSLKLFYPDSYGESIEYTLPSIFDRVAETSKLPERIKMINHFNSLNRWKKRGISRIPIVHEVTLWPTPGRVSILNDGSIVVEVGGIEIGQGLWTKVKQMAAFAFGRLWEDGGHAFLARIRMIQADTLSMVQGGMTAGSTTSEASCEAVRICCDILIERLRPLKESLDDQNGEASWNTLITKANITSVNLSVSAYWVPDPSAMRYLNYGAAVSEAEIDLLTGATTTLQTDIVYDCGQSLNPAVDLGQVEGAFVQGLGFFMFEEYLSNSDGMVITEGTWTYKIPTIDVIPRKFNVELLKSGHHSKRVLSSKASGEPPLLLSASVHCATRAAIREARKEYSNDSFVWLDVPATMPVVKELCGLDNVEKYLESFK